MMSQPKPFASLSSGLLARKGQARPAMRPQGFSGFGSVTGAMDDLGWNDMGPNDAVANEAVPAPAPVLPIVPGVAAETGETPVPSVLRDRAALHGEFADAQAEIAPETADVEEPAPVIAQLASAKRRKAGNGKGGKAGKAVVARNKAAFTLRLDADRHLRLRLASALTHQSAQQLVTAALDAMLRQMPEIEAMATRVVGQNDHQVEIGS